jgi:hypothetical protein
MAESKANRAIWKSNHLKALEALGFNPAQFRTLRILEERMRRSALRYCNDSSYSAEELESMKEKITAKIAKMHGGTLPAGFHLNSDPRGCALKIDPDDGGIIPAGMHKDFGGYGIIAPNFNE